MFRTHDPSGRPTRRTPARWLGALALTWLAALAVTTSSAQAIGTLNSECNPPSEGFVPIWLGSVAAQTFPAKSSGKLLTVTVKAVSRAAEGTGGDINVVLYGTEGGTPVTPALASTTIPSASIPADDHIYDFTANFSPETAAYLTSGQAYAIALSTGDSVQNVWFFAGENKCTGVALFSGGPPFGYSFGHEDWDAGLKTYLGPENDDFERALVLSGQNTAVEGTTAGATRQTGEPDHYVTNPPDSNLWEGDHSVWFRWTAPNSGPTTIDTCIGEIDSILTVYTGSALNALTRVADNNNDPACAAHDEYGSKVSFEAIGGTTYDIAVGDAGGAREKPFGLIIAGSPDITPPETQIDSGPSGPTTNASPTFGFSSSEAGSTFECRLDSNQAAAFTTCTSPKSYSSLSLGAHTFEVRATDEAENVDPTPAARSFVIEAPHESTGLGRIPKVPPPDTTIRKEKISQANDRATFRFASNEPGPSFLCKLDRKPFRACKSPKTYRHLKPGKHRFQVEAVNPAGEPDPKPAGRTFKIKP